MSYRCIFFFLRICVSKQSLEKHTSILTYNKTWCASSMQQFVSLLIQTNLVKHYFLFPTKVVCCRRIPWWSSTDKHYFLGVAFFFICFRVSEKASHAIILCFVPFSKWQWSDEENVSQIASCKCLNPQLTFTCLKTTIETLEKVVKYIQI